MKRGLTASLFLVFVPPVVVIECDLAAMPTNLLPSLLARNSHLL